MVAQQGPKGNTRARRCGQGLQRSPWRMRLHLDHTVKTEVAFVRGGREKFLTYSKEETSFLLCLGCQKRFHGGLLSAADWDLIQICR